MYIVFLGMIAAVPALATDMYLAAMPTIASKWGVPESRVGLSLVLWFTAFSVLLLVCGPLSDKYGRKPILLTGLVVFIASSLACAAATGIWQLIAFRVLQGSGAAGPSSMAMAICRDKYDGVQRKRALAYVGIVLSMVPALAPMIGASLLKLWSWRAIFLTQAVLGAVTLLISTTRYSETARERLSAHFFGLMARYVNLVRNRRYFLTNNAMGLLLGPFYGFIAFSSIIYIQLFGLSERAFSLLFALNAGMSMLGPFVCMRLIRRFSDAVLLSVCLIGCTLAGAGLLAFGSAHYLAFAGCMCVFTFFCGVSRPLSNNLILQQVEYDIGSASGFIVFYQFMVGAICMRIATIEWSTPITAFGLLALVMPATVLAIWPFILRMLAAQKVS